MGIVRCTEQCAGSFYITLAISQCQARNVKSNCRPIAMPIAAFALRAKTPAQSIEAA
jgi:hypothetical protein